MYVFCLVTKWHVRRNLRVAHLGQRSFGELCFYCCRWVGVSAFEVLCDMNHACFQGQTEVSAKLVVPSDNGLL